jgi:MFS family permease
MIKDGSHSLLSLAARLALLLIGWLSAIALTTLTPVLAQISAHFADTPGADAVIRGLVTSVGAAMIVGAPAGGFLSERFGERAVLLWSLPLFAVAGGAGLLLDDPWALLVSRVLLGLSVGAAGVAAAALLANGVADADRNRWLGYFTLSGMLAGVLFTPISGLLGSIHWRYVFPIHLIAIPMLCAIWILVRPAQKSVSSQHAQERQHSTFPWGIVILGMACGVAASGLIAYLPFLFSEMGFGDPKKVATALTSGILGSAITAFFFGAVRRRLDVVPVFAIGFLLVAIGVGVICATRAYELHSVGMFLAGLGNGLLTPNLYAVATSTSPDQRARRLGLARAGYFGAPLVAQLPFEPLAATHGALGVMFAIAGFAIVMIGVVFLSRNRLAAPA